MPSNNIQYVDTEIRNDMTTTSLDYYGIEELLTEKERGIRDRAHRFDAAPGECAVADPRRGWADRRERPGHAAVAAGRP